MKALLMQSQDVMVTTTLAIHPSIEVSPSPAKPSSCRKLNTKSTLARTATSYMWFLLLETIATSGVSVAIVIKVLLRRNRIVSSLARKRPAMMFSVWSALGALVAYLRHPDSEVRKICAVVATSSTSPNNAQPWPTERVGRLGGVPDVQLLSMMTFSCIARPIMSHFARVDVTSWPLLERESFSKTRFSL